MAYGVRNKLPFKIMLVNKKNVFDGFYDKRAITWARVQNVVLKMQLTII